MRFIYSFLLLLMLGNVAQAQQPGFMGKHFYAELTTGVMSLGGSQNLTRIPINLQFGLKANYLLSRRTVLGLHLGMFKTASGIAFYQQLASGWEPQDTYMRSHLMGESLMLSVDIHTKRNGNLAPFGFYWSPKIGVLFTQNRYADSLYVNTPNNASVTVTQIEPTSTFSNIGKRNHIFALFAGEVGYKTVVAGRITLRASFQVGVTSASIHNPYRSSIDLNEYHNYAIRRRIKDMCAASFVFGVGVLLF